MIPEYVSNNQSQTVDTGQMRLICVVDNNGRIVRITEGVSHILQQPKAAILGRHFFDFFENNSGEDLSSIIKGISQGNEIAENYSLIAVEGVAHYQAHIMSLGGDQLLVNLYPDSFNNTLFHSSIPNSSTSFLALDSDLCFTYGNAAAKETLRRYCSYTLNLGDHISVIHRDDEQENLRLWLDNCKLVFEEERTISFEMTKNSDSGFSYFKVDLYPIREADIVKGICCVANDLTETFLREKLQDALSSFKSKLIKTVSVNELLWCVTDDVLAKLYLEEALILMKHDNVLRTETAFGVRRGEGREMKSLLDVPVGKGIVGDIVLKGKGEIINDTSNDKRYFNVHFDAGSEIAVPIILNKEVIGVINCESSYKNFFRPIHLEILTEVAEVTAERIDQIEAETRYRKIQELNDAVLSSTPNNHLLLDPELNVISLNDTARNYLSLFAGKEIEVGDSFKRFVPEEYQAEFEELALLALKGEFIQTERQLYHEELSDFWIKLNAAQAVNKNNGEVFGITVIIGDITPEKKAEKLILEQNEKLEQANKELDKFIYSVSHDLRSPVSSVMGITTLISFADNIKEIQEYNLLIKESMQRMDAFIKNILDYSRNTRVHVEIETVDMDKLVDGIISDHQYMRGVEDIDIRKDIRHKNHSIR